MKCYYQNNWIGFLCQPCLLRQRKSSNCAIQSTQKAFFVFLQHILFKLQKYENIEHFFSHSNVMFSTQWNTHLTQLYFDCLKEIYVIRLYIDTCFRLFCTYKNVKTFSAWIIIIRVCCCMNVVSMFVTSKNNEKTVDKMKFLKINITFFSFSHNWKRTNDWEHESKLKIKKKQRKRHVSFVSKLHTPFIGTGARKKRYT